MALEPPGEVIRMRRWSVWTASVIGAVGAGAGLAAATSRRGQGRPPEPAEAPPQLPVAMPDGPDDDPEAALDAACERLRRRADELRQRIDSSGDGSGGG
jgi:hypothetical protein